MKERPEGDSTNGFKQSLSVVSNGETQEQTKDPLEEAHKDHRGFPTLGLVVVDARVAQTVATRRAESILEKLLNRYRWKEKR